jgi:hypothetical protein
MDGFMTPVYISHRSDDIEGAKRLDRKLSGFGIRRRPCP